MRGRAPAIARRPRPRPAHQARGDPGEVQPGQLASHVERWQQGPNDALSRAIDGEQAESGIGPGDHEQQLGDMPVDHEHLGPVQPERPRAPGRRLRRLRRLPRSRRRQGRPTSARRPGPSGRRPRSPRPSPAASHRRSGAGTPAWPDHRRRRGASGRPAPRWRRTARIAAPGPSPRRQCPAPRAWIRPRRTPQVSRVLKPELVSHLLPDLRIEALRPP